MMDIIKVVQINLHHSRAASAIMCRKLLADNIDVALIQEPWLSGGKIRCLRCKGGSIISPNCDNPRTHKYVKKRINSMANLRFCSRDTITVEVSTVVCGCRRTIRFSSIYLPYEVPEPPSAIMRDIVQHSAQERKEIILGIDANAHHTLWGNMDISPRTESLIEYMESTKLNILNKGNEPTFLKVRRRQVIDLTLGTTLVVNLVSDWHLSSEESLSDQN
jgi:hypothetical protein